MSEQREKLNLTKEQARELIDDYNDGFEVVSDEIIDQRRWVTVHKVIVRRLSDSKFFTDHYQHGSTESQDECPYEYTEPDFTEVFPKEKKIVTYE